MAEFSLYSIGGIGSDYPRPSNPGTESHREKVESSSESKSPVPMDTFPGHTRLVFKVDESKNEIVVMIVDEDSSEVIRTVPGNAMKDLPSGGLIERNA